VDGVWFSCPFSDLGEQRGYFASISVNECDFGHLGFSELLVYVVGGVVIYVDVCSLNCINGGFGLMLVGHTESGTLNLFGYLPVGMGDAVAFLPVLSSIFLLMFHAFVSLSY
jgi:hypothetical protein